MLIQTKVSDHIQIFSQDPIPFNAEGGTGLIRARRPLLILRLMMHHCQGVLNEARDCRKVKKGLTMNADGSCLGKPEFIPIYDTECYFMLSNHFNPTFLACLQGSLFLWCLLCRTVYKSELKLYSIKLCFKHEKCYLMLGMMKTKILATVNLDMQNHLIFLTLNAL